MFGLLILILDSKTALSGARDGLDICMRVLIPTLFPFFFLSSWLRGTMYRVRIPGLFFLTKAFSIPKGSETMLLSGILGGYPVGALAVDQAVREGALSSGDGKRLICICNQCGPAFIFGISAVMFDHPLAGWLLMLIQLVSTMITARLLPGGFGNCVKSTQFSSQIHPMDQSLRSTATVCGWVILFKTLVTFLQRWVLWLLPQYLQATAIGILELSNGCLLLDSIQQTHLRFILAAVLLNFGGLCVTMQTFSLAKQTDKRLYLPAKLLQATVAATIASALCRWQMIWVGLLISVVLVVILRKNEKRCRNPQTVVV